MRNIGPDWRDLAEGHLRVEALEARFHAEWSPRIEEAWRKRSEAEKQNFRKRGRIALVCAAVLAFLLLAVGLVLPSSASVVSSVVFTLAIVVPATLVLVGGLFFLHTTEPLPEPSDVSAQWWDTIARGASSVRAATPNQPARYYGDVGEVAFTSYLASRLPDGYVAVRGLLVDRRLDADVVVVGPMGVGVYEVKNWTGQIFCHGGQWHRIKTYRGPGGHFVQEYEALKPFDRQWIKEAGAVKEALRLGFPEYRDLHKAIGGGIVFPHEGASFSGDGSCRARVYRPGSCAEALLRSPAAPDFTMEKRLRVVDALLRWSDGLHQQQGEATSAGSSVELAERLHRDAVSLARRYLSEVDEASGEATAPASGSHEGPSESPKIPA
ncbi:MAG: NERD domain-containing protein [Actinomycetota bacterium]|nr:NERD domain-containing protein [Actinomycetota bacterium]